jgi:hypothetical protein
MDKIIRHFKNSQDILKIFSLDLNTGIFTYKIKTNRNIIIGQKAGTPDKNGYISLHINGKHYSAHRLAFYCYHSYLPDKPLIIEHTDGNKQNNSINNLRVATQQQNVANRKSHSHKKYKGVYYNKNANKNKYYSQIKCRDKRYHLGMFSNQEDAGKAYDKKAYELYGRFARLNFPLD